MKVILDIKENNRVPFFIEMVKSLDYNKYNQRSKR
jgi:hypothetical protein